MDNYEQTFQTWDQLACQYQDKFMNLNIYNDTYDLFCREVKIPRACVLEIGCGPGNITKYLLSRRPDFKIEGVDVSPNMIKLARANNPSAEFKIMDCREMDRWTSTVDAIICGFCMPYLSKEDCAKFIKDCAALLPSGGILYFSIIEDAYAKSGYETSSDGNHKMFVYYHEAIYLQEHLKQNDFKLMHTERKLYPKKEKTETHLIFIARKNNRRQKTI
jgi:cyclopropane fatty-acyl-phospholipid synthase-like methyltransferase